jgi:hypothetical protein
MAAGKDNSAIGMVPNLWLALGRWLEAEALVRGIYAIAYGKAAE